MKNLRAVLPFSALLFLLTLAADSLALDVGDQAPPFTAQSTAGTLSSSSVLDGGQYLVLAFYYQAFTPV